MISAAILVTVTVAMVLGLVIGEKIIVLMIRRTWFLYARSCESTTPPLWSGSMAYELVLWKYLTAALRK